MIKHDTLITLANNKSNNLINIQVTLKQEMNQPQKDELLKQWSEFSQNVTEYIHKMQVIPVDK